MSGYSYANAFDGAGNATTFRNDAKTYNDDNQLTGPGTYVYDGNGNPTTFGGTSLSFDVENRMTGYGTALTAGYRGDGLRAWKQPGGGNKTYFLYDGISVLCELDDTGAVSASSTYGANGLLSRGTAQYQFDPLGDAVLLLDGSGDLTATQGFDAWGNALVTATGPFGYRARYGYFADSETGLVALAYRYYAPGVGRFLNRDPVVHRGGVNVYCYVRNSPLGRTDTTGLEPPSIERPRPRPGPNPLDGVYGRYCGPQFVPGVGDPVDGLDACCKGHDDCFSQHGCNVLNQTCRRWCRLCTEALCNCFNDPRRCDDAADREMCKSMQRLFKMLYCNFVFEGVF